MNTIDTRSRGHFSRYSFAMPLFDALTSLLNTTSFFSSSVNADAAASGAVRTNADSPAAPKTSASPTKPIHKHHHEAPHNTVICEHSPVHRRTPSPTRNLCSPMRHCSPPPPPRAVDCCARGRDPVVTAGLAGELHIAVPHTCTGVWGDPTTESCDKKTHTKHFTMNYHGKEDNDYRLLADHDITLDAKLNHVHTCGHTGRKNIVAVSTVRATTSGGHEIQVESNGLTTVDGNELPVRASITLHDNHGHPIDVYHSPKGVLIATNHGRNHVSIEAHGSYLDVLPEGHFKLDNHSLFGTLFGEKSAHGINFEKFNLSKLHEAHIHNITN